MKKKLFAIMCTLFAIQMAVWAQETSGYCGNPNVNEGKDVTWKLEVDEWSGDTTLIISGTGEMVNFETPEGRPWNLFANTIKYVIIEEGVTSVGDAAFAFCEGLIRVESRSDVGYIGMGAFVACHNLVDCRELIFLAEVIGEAAFGECFSLRGIDESEYGGGKSMLYLEASEVGRHAFVACPNIDWVELLGSQYVDESAFEKCVGLKALVVGPNVQTIADAAFSGCENLVTVKCYADTPPTLGENVFEDIHPEAELVFDSYIADDFDALYAYYTSDWAKYFEISVPLMASGFCGDPNVNNGEDVKWELSADSVLTISGVGAMDNYGSTVSSPWRDYPVISVVVKEGVTNVGDRAFEECANMESIELPGSCTIIGNNAFAGCYSLKSIVIPESVTSLGAGAFSLCSSLKSIVIPEGVTSIGDCAFLGCYSLESVNIPENVNFIDNATFIECGSLTSIVIPATVSYIRGEAFFNCNNLSVVTCLNPVPPTIDHESAFWGISPTAILRVPDVEAYKASDWAKFFPTIVDLDTDISGIGGVKADKDAPVTIHDLSGRRVTVPVKGQIYIVNGKAVVW